jgi:hypothetical protein
MWVHHAALPQSEFHPLLTFPLRPSMALVWPGKDRTLQVDTLLRFLQSIFLLLVSLIQVCLTQRWTNASPIYLRSSLTTLLLTTGFPSEPWIQLELLEWASTHHSGQQLPKMSLRTLLNNSTLFRLDRSQTGPQ